MTDTTTPTRASSLPAAPGSPRARRARSAAVAGVLVASLLGGGLLTACGSDADAGADPTETTAAPSTTATRTRTVVVSATDYAFQSLPDEIPAGTRLQLENDSAVEIHELVAIRVPDGDDRPVEDLLRDPALETMAPAAVLVTPPGGEQIPAVGDGTLTEPGRYLVICTIPTGVDPQVFLEAAQAAGGGKPEIPNAGAPHLAHGMFAELTVV